MIEDLRINLEPRVRELGTLVKEGTAEWRNKEPLQAEQKFLRAAALRGQLGQTADDLLQNYNIDLQKVDKILAETLNNFAVINLDHNRPDRALELATNALDLILKLEHFDQEYFNTLDILKEIHAELNREDEDFTPTPTIRFPLPPDTGSSQHGEDTSSAEPSEKAVVDHVPVKTAEEATSGNEVIDYDPGTNSPAVKAKPPAKKESAAKKKAQPPAKSTKKQSAAKKTERS